MFGTLGVGWVMAVEIPYERQSVVVIRHNPTRLRSPSGNEVSGGSQATPGPAHLDAVMAVSDRLVFKPRLHRSPKTDACCGGL